MSQQTFSFQTEVKQLLQLMIHSLYSNKEIFLRELISNASDAADKLRFAAIADPSLFENDTELKITLAVDHKNRTLTVSDNGIGMSKEEVIENLGTIAQSGTQAFLQSLSDDGKKDVNLIGQFGVGFYSVFMVADKVSLKTRRAGLSSPQGVLWESTGEGEYTIGELDKTTRGTEIILHLKESENDLLSDWTIKRIIRTYSDHIAIPIEMAKGTSYTDDGKPIESDEMVVVNQASALWMRNKNDITEEQYKTFYQHISHDLSEPLAWHHARLEGRQSYTELLYIPARAPFDLYHPERKTNIKLYVRRVFIMEAAQQLLPNYLRFVRGVVDSDDLPLNVSREILQASRDVEAIKNGCSKKVLGLLEDLAKDRCDDYQVFWREFGQVLKEGIVEDHPHQERIAKLLRFSSTHSADESANTSLSDYVSRMKVGQEKIYYITADSLLAAQHSPHLEVFRQKGIEVLLLVDRIDEWLMAELTAFGGKSFQSITKGELDLGELEDEKDKKKQQQIRESAQPVIEKIKKALGDKVADVRATARLIDSPACLVVGEKEMSTHLERLLASAGQKSPQQAKPILEFNPKHPFIKRLSEENNNKQIKDLCSVLYDQAWLIEGGKLDDPASFIAKMNALLFKKVV